MAWPHPGWPQGAAAEARWGKRFLLRYKEPRGRLTPLESEHQLVPGPVGKLRPWEGTDLPRVPCQEVEQVTHRTPHHWPSPLSLCSDLWGDGEETGCAVSLMGNMAETGSEQGTLQNGACGVMPALQS